MTSVKSLWAWLLFQGILIASTSAFVAPHPCRAPTSAPVSSSMSARDARVVTMYATWPRQNKEPENKNKSPTKTSPAQQASATPTGKPPDPRTVQGLLRILVTGSMDGVSILGKPQHNWVTNQKAYRQDKSVILAKKRKDTKKS